MCKSVLKGEDKEGRLHPQYKHRLAALNKYSSPSFLLLFFLKIICKVSQLELYTMLTHLQRSVGFSSYTNRSGRLFLLWFTNMLLRSTDQQLAFWVLYFSMWCAVSLRISVQTASLWQRVRWVASDTTSQTTHQTNPLKALSTLTLYHLICVIKRIYWH